MVVAGTQPELLQPEVNPADLLQQQQRQSVQQAVQAQGLSLPGSLLSQTLKQNNPLVLTQGVFGALLTKAPNTSVQGVPGSQLEQLSVRHDVKLQGVHVVGQTSVTDGATATFTHMHFDDVVHVSPTSKATFLNCTWGPKGRIVNQGSPTTVGLFGAKSTLPHQNISTIFET